MGYIQDALLVANLGDQIWICQGTYTPSTTGNRNDRFTLTNGISIYGGFNGTETPLSQRDSSLITNKTIISGEIQGDADHSNNAFSLFYINALDQEVQLNSLILREGNHYNPSTSGAGTHAGMIQIQNAAAKLANLEIAYNTGTAIFIHQSNVHMNAIKVHHNEVSALGGGINIDNELSSIHVTKVTVRNSEFYENIASFGGGICSKMSTDDSLIIENCKIYKNTAGELGGGGISITEGNNILNKVEITNNYVTGLWDGGGGMQMNTGILIMHDGLIANNSIAGEEGGRINVWYIEGAFINCTFAQNKAESFPGNHMYLADCPILEFNNCIFDSVGHAGLPDFVPWWGWELTENATFTNCLFEGVFPAFWIDGGGNISEVNPGFIGGGNYQLSEGSAAVNRGNNTFRTVSYTDDLAGNNRIHNDTVDIGCYELITKGEPNSMPNIMTRQVIKIYPNPANAMLYIENIKPGATLLIYDITGRQVMTTQINTEVEIIDISFLKEGLYYAYSNGSKVPFIIAR